MLSGKLKLLLVAMLAWLPAVAVAADAEALPVAVKADDANIRYVGRYDGREPAGPRFNWTMAGFVAKFQGTSINAEIEGGGNRLQVVVDGEPTRVVTVKKEQKVYTLATELADGEHKLEVYNRTEAGTGTFKLLGLQLEAGKKLLAPPPAADKRILVIGDSISCGYGNEVKGPGGGNPPDKQNGYMTYGAIAARDFNAEVQVVAWSGRCLYPGNTIVSLYDQGLAGDGKSAVDLTKWVPQVVVIDLGTNDFRSVKPDESKWTDKDKEFMQKWTEAYKAFVGTIRKTAPEAHIFIAIGPMWTAPDTVWDKYCKQVVKELNDAGDAKVYYLRFPVQDANKDGLGGDWHPTVKTHKKMGALFSKNIAEKLGWTKIEPASQPADK